MPPRKSTTTRSKAKSKKEVTETLPLKTSAVGAEIEAPKPPVKPQGKTTPSAVEDKLDLILRKLDSGEVRNPYLVPIALLVAGLSISGAIFFTRNVSPAALANNNANNQVKAQPTTSQDAVDPNENPLADKVKAVNDKDHIRGSKTAGVKIVQFSDIECPFCKRFHPTMKQVMDEYGAKGQVAWIFRQFPLDQLHPHARKAAEASECVAELGGNDKFWLFLDKVSDQAAAATVLDPVEMSKIAVSLGIDKTKFDTCVSSGRLASLVAEDEQDGQDAGARGTPYSILIAPNGKKTVINGAQPYAVVKQMIDAALKLK
ncbi:MAG: DsbA family protein [bacterium]